MTFNARSVMSNMGTAFEFATGRRRGAEPVLIFPVASSPKPPMELLTHVDAACQGAVSELIGVGAVPEKPGQIAHTTRSGRCRRVLVVSLGKHDQITVQTVRDAARAAARWLIDQKVQRAALWVDGLIRSPLERPVSEFAGAMVVGGFQFDEHKHPDPPPPETVRIALRSGDAAYLTGATGRGWVTSRRTCCTPKHWRPRPGGWPASTDSAPRS
jgi:leucyl aminopeptidase